MKLTVIALTGLVLGLFASPQPALSQDSSAASKLEVRIKYTGAGTVDEKHKIYVALWDSTDFVHGEGMPVEVQSASSKNGVVTFEDVKKSPAYVSAFLDASGTWDAQSGPPEGSPLGLYSKAPGKPEPIDLKAGKTTTIDLAFDDTVKMVAGKPTR